MPKLKHKALTAGHVKSLTKPGTYTDGEGLTLRVSESGGKRWVLRTRVGGQPRNIGLGGYPTVSLAEARRKATANVSALEDGRDPAAERRAAAEAVRAQPPAVPTFAEVTRRVFALRSPGWTKKHADQWINTVRDYGFPTLGERPIDQITTADVLGVLEPVWLSKPETASRVRQRMETIFAYARARGFRSGSNPAGRDVVEVLPKVRRQKEHYKALPYADVPAALEAVRRSSSFLMTVAAIKVLTLTATRSAEARLADWTEIDWDSATWTIPAARMKARREHRVPLSAQALDVLRMARGATGGASGPVFPSPRGLALTDSGLSLVLRRLEIPAVIHGFRSSFRDWAAEKSGASWVVCEAALAHTVGNSVEAAYMRSDMFEQRRVLMQQWADYLT